MSDFEDLKEKKIHTAGNRNFHEKTTTTNYVFPQTLKFKKENQEKNEVVAEKKKQNK